LRDSAARPCSNLARGQLGGRSRGARTEVGQRDSEFGQPLIVRVVEQDRRQARRVKQPPERVAAAGEMMAERAGPQAGIDADQQHPRPVDDDVP
jgi:hypothetical protein